MRFFNLFNLFLVFIFLAQPVWAQTQEPHHTRATLISPVTAVGETFSVPLGVKIDLDAGWKTYWRTPGDAGLAVSFDWTGSENLKTATVRWPAPHRFIESDLDNFGYKDSVVFPIDAALENPGQPLKIKLKLDLLVCNKICLPETQAISFDLPAGTAKNSSEKNIYDTALRSIPETEGTQFVPQSAYLDYDASNINYLSVTAKIPQEPSDDADLFVEHGSGLVFSKPAITYDREHHTATFKMPVHSNAAIDDLHGQLAPGSITLTYVDSAFSAENKTQLGARPADAPALDLHPERQKIIAGFSLAKIALFAFLGGLILNLMPCVLPVLSLKILSVVSHGGKDSRATIFKNFMASAAGIVFAFWILAGALVAFKAAGAMIGWGIQFQHPAFLVFLTIIVLIFAANMWGMFDIPLPRFIAKNIPARHEHESTLAGHFMTGIFATLLATPCTAPFLGTAVGFALARAPFDIFAVFSMIGAGMSFPYILLALSPKMFRYLPKPGRWMVGLKKILAVLLLATAGWLAHVLVTISTTPTIDSGWEKFDESLIAPAVRDGKIVVVDVTADWCLTCKANKRLVLKQPDIIEALSDPQIVKLQADWTHRDETIGAYLQKFGRYGIPFDIVYGPAAPEGIVLPELLSKKTVLNALTEAAGE